MASKNHSKRKKRKASNHKGLKVIRSPWSIGQLCCQCYKFRVGTCDRTSRHIERYGFLKLRKREVTAQIAFCSTGILDIGYLNRYFEEHGDLPEYAKEFM